MEEGLEGKRGAAGWDQDLKRSMGIKEMEVNVSKPFGKSHIELRVVSYNQHRRSSLRTEGALFLHPLLDQLDHSLIVQLLR